MKRIITIAMVIIIMVMLAVPCFANAEGGNQRTIYPVIPWRDLTIKNGGNGQYETIVYDWSQTALTDDDGDGEYEQKASFTTIEGEYTRIGRIAFRPSLNNDGTLFIWKPNDTYFLGTNTSQLYDTIELGYTGLWAINSTTGVELRVYEFGVGWADNEYRGFNFTTGALYNVPMIGTKASKWLETNATAIFAYYRDGEYVSLSNAYDKKLQFQSLTDWDTTTGQYIQSTTAYIPSQWQTGSPTTNISMSAQNFIVKMSSSHLTTDEFPEDLYIRPIDNEDTVTVTYDCVYSYADTREYENHTTRTLITKSISGNVELTEQQYNIKTGCSIPFEDIKENSNNAIIDGDLFIINNLVIRIAYTDHLIDGPYNPSEPWKESGQLILTMTYNVNTPIYSTSYYIREIYGDIVNNYPANSNRNPFDVVKYIFAPIDAIMNVELFGTFTIGEIMGVCIAIGVVFVVLKTFAGG